MHQGEGSDEMNRRVPDVPRQGIIARYRDWLPVPPGAEPLTLGEGDTPLIRADRLLQELPPDRRPPAVFLKFEGANPTGSFKDRGMTIALTCARARGARAVICASTGNTAAAAAAYAARAGMDCWLVLPAGGVAAGKVGQAVACGARILPVRGSFDDALAAVRQVVAERPELVLVNSLNPDRLEGQKTAAFEVADQLAALGLDEPAAVFLPVGNGGNITAYHMGFSAYAAAGRLRRMPRLYGVQAEGAAPLVRGQPVDRPQTVASAIRIGRPVYGERALAAVRETGGRVLAVRDDEILAAQRLLARREGVFAEPASAASVAGLLKLAQGDEPGWEVPKGPVVCVLTGHGLKDVDTALRAARAGQGGPAPADLAALEAEALEPDAIVRHLLSVPVGGRSG
ncbi:L-threonine synthase [Thermaerobacter marianensis DSM 12885]|uniref:Threonine synthase n=2 Tax=Thermaerobacter marianensis TaxID=73919 RepID=E6SHW5_THEM7|nr:L-threonine synthase [Thermaerobacter marianensis DSM 12885]